MARGKKGSSRVTRSAKAGLTFPVARTKRVLKGKLASSGGKGMRVSWGAVTYATAVAEYLAAEVLEISGNCAKSFRLRRINPRHIMLSTQNDQELAQLLSKVTIPNAGVMPRPIHDALLPKAQRGQAANTGAAPPAKKRTVSAKKAAPAKKASRMTKAMRATLKKGAKITATMESDDRGDKGITTLGSRTLGGGQILSIVSADIVEVPCDAIVVPSSSNWNLGGQVGNRLSKVGGSLFRSSVNEVSSAKGPLAANEAGLVDGDNFEARYVMFCNGPSWKGNESAKAIADLNKTIANCLALADQCKLTSICIPSVGSGVASFPKQTAAQTILKAINAYFKGNRLSPTIKKVIFDLYDDESVNVYKLELGRMVE